MINNILIFNPKLIVKEENINNTLCSETLTKLTKNLAFNIYIKMIKKDLEINAEIDWKQKYNFDKIQNCIKCINLNVNDFIEQ